MQRLGQLCGILKEICVSDGWSERYDSDEAREVARDVSSASFWSNLKKLRLHLKPLKCFIRLVDSDAHTAEHVYPGMVRVEEVWKENTPGVSSAYKTFTLKVCSLLFVYITRPNFVFCSQEHKERFEWMLFPVHYAAYACSPRYHEDNVFGLPKLMTGLRQILRHYCSFRSLNFSAVMKQRAEFKNATLPADSIDPTYLNDVTAKDWWQTWGSTWPQLQVIMIVLFSVGTASSASERNFSAWQLIWSGRRNNLTFNRAHKLVYCHFNIRALQSLRNSVLHRTGIPAGWLEERIEEEE